MGTRFTSPLATTTTTSCLSAKFRGKTAAFSIKMDFNLEALFLERLDLFAELPSVEQSEIEDTQATEAVLLTTVKSTQSAQEASKAREIIDGLTQEIGALKAKFESQVRMKNALERRLYRKEAPRDDFEAEIDRRLERLELENVRLQSEAKRLKDSLRIVESENTTLGNENQGKSRKLKGANKKVRDAKDVSNKEKEKAKGAVLDKQRHLESERRMKKERNESKALLETQKKLVQRLREELDIEQSGDPHTRDVAEDRNNVTVVIPIQFEIRRGDFRVLLPNLESNQITITDGYKRWYEEWKKPKPKEEQKIVGADYVNDQKKARLYEDMIEGGFMQTGAEHDSWRSKRGVEAVCRHAEDHLKSHM